LVQAADFAAAQQVDEQCKALADSYVSPGAGGEWVLTEAGKAVLAAAESEGGGA